MTDQRGPEGGGWREALFFIEVVREAPSAPLVVQRIAFGDSHGFLPGSGGLEVPRTVRAGRARRFHRLEFAARSAAHGPLAEAVGAPCKKFVILELVADGDADGVVVVHRGDDVGDVLQ